ncbi:MULTISPECIES: methyltransferase domain-containing protein [Paenibacillus]|uniref:Helix-turn-helix domain protein n=2 Tax=Paenibacillus lactis TaxID=228574 RepID=G4HIF2_9BACL|nr:methyltransferase domain-containing protein [Paenibacillus lactis]EHB63125.1 helix-turn-helix domain protein [Paenibacillus lactis 154]MBP1894854.1 tellurite methyltransferase [Paenibacillus lactis]HAG00315.1 helix-turn-helix domain-containing protein [Paenibacillus lactis]
MKETLARNIAIYRKEKGLTQEELAQILGLSFQAVSKWENAQSMPDIALLPELSRTLEVSIDKLLGYTAQDKRITIYEEEYKTQDYYWGTEPNDACYQVLQLMPPTKRLRLLDIGCGEGKDAVFFARNGYEVSAFDVSDAGIEKTRSLAEKTGVHVHVFKADILDYRLDTHYDIIFSSGVLHYIKPEYRKEIFDNYKQFTNENGIHVFNVFVNKPFIAPPPEKEPNAYKWYSGELLTHYHDWLMKDSSEIVFDCNSSGIPHKHAMTNMIAQKITSFS